MNEVKIEVEHATLADRIWLALSSIADRRLGRVEEAINDSYTDSYGLLSRLGEADSTEGSQKATRWSRIKELRKKYKAEAAKGNQIVGAITDFHAALQFGQGLRSKDLASDDPENPSPEMEAWEAFLDVNNLDEESLIAIGVAGELDGQILLRFAADATLDDGRGQVRAWVVPLLETRYRIDYDNPWEPKQAVLYPDGFGQKDETRLYPDIFSFVRLRGVMNGTYGIPRCARILDELDNLADAITDWRKINRIFASPTPLFKSKDMEGVKRIQNAIVAMNWKIGKAFVMLDSDSYELVGLDGGEHASLKEEITRLAQFVSAATNVPVHYLGFPELMSNRSVADSDMEPALKATEKTQKEFMGFLEDMKAKVFGLLSDLHGTTYDPEAVDVAFPSVRKGNIDEALKAWLPVRVAKQISQKTFLSQIGIEDVDAEIQAIEDEGAADAEGADEEEARVLSIVDAAAKRAEGAA